MTSPSDRCYVCDSYRRISAEGQLKAAASGKYGSTPTPSASTACSPTAYPSRRTEQPCASYIGSLSNTVRVDRYSRQSPIRYLVPIRLAQQHTTSGRWLGCVGW